jgi:hypothetical protein
MEFGMSARRAKLMMICFLLLGLLLGIWAGIAIKTFQIGNRVGTQHAIRVVRITIDPSQQEKLFVQIRKFADKWRYAIRIAPLDPSNETFSIQLWRSDMKLSGLYPNDPGTLDIGFFYTDPAQPVSSQYFDEEISDLKSLINEIPGATLAIIPGSP